jgi:hypothetical protein
MLAASKLNLISHPAQIGMDQTAHFQAVQWPYPFSFELY